MQDRRFKTILDEHMEEVAVTCDLILHSRGEIASRDNLIAIEMKKSDRPREEKEKDRVRLRALTKPSCWRSHRKEGCPTQTDQPRIFFPDSYTDEARRVE
jgi:hypothetical protein